MKQNDTVYSFVPCWFLSSSIMSLYILQVSICNTFLYYITLI